LRLYNKNIVTKRLREAQRYSVVDRDAIIWNVDTGNYYALVKIQGSNTQIKAHYPRNWKKIPTWLKKGNAVRIRHRSGVPGFIEVVGHGRAIPSPVEGDLLPTASELENGIVSGMEILEYSGGGMNVIVNDGTYRIDGTLYTYSIAATGYIVMDDPAPMTMGSGFTMGFYDTATSISISAAPAGTSARYDALVIGINGVVDVVEGTSRSITAGAPTKPSIPADHILIGYLFIYSGMTSISSADIGVEWTEPKANTVSITSAIKQGDGSFEMEWDGGTNYPTASFTFSIKDQYDFSRPISVTATFSVINGTGLVSNTDSGGWASSATKVCGSSVTFYYQRDQTETPEIPPFLKIEFEDYTPLTTLIVIRLLDSGGDPI